MLLDRIRRVTRDGRWIPEIDGLRFLAIISVLLLHLLLELQLRSGRSIPVEPRYELILLPINNGSCGVRLFFVISGFVLALPFARHFLAGADAVSLRKYYMRRVTRLEPPYLLTGLLFVVFLAIHLNGVTADLLRHAAVSAVYAHGLVYGAVTPINPISWSLEIEVQFYIAAPLLAQLYRIRVALLRRALLVSLIAGATLAQVLIDPLGRASLSILFYAQFFLMGLLLADLYIVDGNRIRRSFLWDAAGAAGLLLTFGLSGSGVLARCIMPWAMAFVFLGAFRGTLLPRFFANPWIAVIGGMCYSIYLLHWLLIAAVFKVTRHCISTRLDFLANYGIQLLVTGLPILAISLLFYLLVERPCMDPNWPSKFWRRVSGRSGTEAAAFDTAGISA
jgi:peptidoglycan/LPS O-acetylase OafA/YrhL